jgi:Mn2+/Fe2+ NRAMP family transporter
MQSWDPMRNFPELDGLDPAEAKKLIRQTQRKISLQPVIFVGLIVTAVIAATVIFNVLPTRTILQSFIAGGLVGLVIVAYMVLVIKPRMKEAFRAMGYPRSTIAAPPR